MTTLLLATPLALSPSWKSASLCKPISLYLLFPIYHTWIYMILIYTCFLLLFAFSSPSFSMRPILSHICMLIFSKYVVSSNVYNLEHYIIVDAIAHKYILSIYNSEMRIFIFGIILYYYIHTSCIYVTSKKN